MLSLEGADRIDRQLGEMTRLNYARVRAFPLDVSSKRRAISLLEPLRQSKSPETAWDALMLRFSTLMTI
jgi:hypothetical protein